MTHIVPRNRDEMIVFYRTHLPAWQADPARVGLTAEQVAQIALLVSEAEAAEAAAADARRRAITATQDLNSKADRLRRFGAGAMATIRGAARIENDVGVYVAARIPGPRKAGPTPPPEPARALHATPTGQGDITLEWKGSIAHGQTFQVMRAVENGPFTIVAAGRFKAWTDTRVPVGARQIFYRIISQRGGRSSTQVAQTSVTFGTVDGSEPMLRSRMAA